MFELVFTNNCIWYNVLYFHKFQKSIVFHPSNQNDVFIFSILEDDDDELPIEEVYEDEMMKK